MKAIPLTEKEIADKAIMLASFNKLVYTEIVYEKGEEKWMI